MQSRFDEAGLAHGRGAGRDGLVEGVRRPRLGIARQRLYERLACCSARHALDFDLPQTRVELSLEVWAARMGEPGP